jgi:heptosyltransferase-3
MNTPPRSILVVVTRRIGDVLLATPLIRSLRQHWPEASIDALVFAGTDGVLAANPDLRRVLTIAERPDARAHLALAVRLWRRYDLAISLVPSDRPTIYAWLAGRTSIGLVVDTAKHRWKQRLLDQWVAYDNTNTHTVNLYLRTLSALGVVATREVVAGWNERDAANARNALRDANVVGEFAVMHPSPKFTYKTWTAEGWRDSGNWLAAQGLQLVLTGGPSESERAYVAEIARLLPAAIDLSGKLSLAETACVLSAARIYIGPDTAVTHLAAALGTPVVALFGPTDPVKWGPWPAGHAGSDNPWRRYGSQRVGNVALVQGGATCVPCMLEGCERNTASDSECLRQLSASRVIAAATFMLNDHSMLATKLNTHVQPIH